MDYIELIFKEFDISYMLYIGGSLITLIGIIFLATIILLVKADNTKSKDKIGNRGFITIMILLCVAGGPSVLHYLNSTSDYVKEGEVYLATRLEESYGIQLSDGDLYNLSSAIYGRYTTMDSDSIKDEGRTIYDPIQVTTDEGTLIAITPVQEGEKLTIYKGTGKDMILMPQKGKP